MLHVPFEFGDKGFGFALAMIADDESREIIFLFFRDGVAQWIDDPDDVLYELLTESENEQRTEEARAVLKKWYSLFEQNVEKYTVPEES